ncbi:TMV resistance protein N [Arachis hypogaea]|nr:TMV resistance protein N [Arachis hypogaea]
MERISTTPPQRICKYDVFISFRGADTRNTFVDHLYNHLIRKGIFIFKDDKTLEQGQPISSQLMQAIRDSRVSIVVFSKEYPTSTWCLDEMAAIVDCQREFNQAILPVFYDVDPSHVRKQNGVYHDAFISHSQRQQLNKVRRWKSAMTTLANSVGWDVRNKPEFKEVENIVQKIVKTLNHKFSGFADDLIGMQPRVEELEKLLKLRSEDDGFRVLGLWGMGGIGKTTHATALYDRISYQFDASCFVENVSKLYKDGGAMAIQKQILRQALEVKRLDTKSPSEISGIIINRLHSIKVLIVLDNVDHLKQLEELAINPKLLCEGSRIIITTRDEHILKAYGADEIHNVPLLSDKEAYELFSRKAFKREGPSNNCEELIPEVLKYAQRHPLTIRVVGSFLCSRNATQWKDALDRLRNNLEDEIANVLRISYEGLQFEEKEIFLHIACFFRGEREDYVKRILDSLGLYPHIGISVIAEKSFITIRNQEIHMHEMLQELGKKIVREKYPQEPGSWSRIWSYKDFHHVLMSETGTNEIKAIVVDIKEDISDCNQMVEGLAKMKDLKMLIVHQKNNHSESRLKSLSSCMKHYLSSHGYPFPSLPSLFHPSESKLKCLSSCLKYLSWHGYPFPSLPSVFHPSECLVEMNLSGSSIKSLWEGRKTFFRLTILDLSNSKKLMETPNFEWCTSLKRLDLSGCTNLQHVHPSIGLLARLVYLNLRNCSSLVTLYFGGDECKLSSLIVLHLSGCTKLETMLDFSRILNLEYLDLEQCTSLAKVHESLWSLGKLRSLSLRGCLGLKEGPNDISWMTSLQTLDFQGCSRLLKLQLILNKYERSKLHQTLGKSIISPRISKALTFLDLGFCNLGKVPDTIGELKGLERLNLQGNKFNSLPCTIESLSSLAYLNLEHCFNLSSLPTLPFVNNSSGGRYFKTISGSRNHGSGLYMLYCPIVDIQRCLNWAFVWLTRLIKQPCHFRCGFDIVIPGSSIPWWFNRLFVGGSTIRIVDSNNMDDNWIGFTFCVAFCVTDPSAITGSSHNRLSTSLPSPFYLSFESEQAEETFCMPCRLDFKGGSQPPKTQNLEHVWIIYISRPHCHFVKTGANITFKACPGIEMRKWGLRMVFKQDIEIIQRNSQYQLEISMFVCPSEILLQDHGLVIEEVPESNNSSIGPKVQLPYNWYVTDEEEKENLEAKSKEINLANIGL